MKKQPAASFTDAALNPERPKPKTLVRYLGFEVIDGHRRLNFSAKSLAVDAVDVTVDIPDAALTGQSRISVQDAVPIAYGKLVRLANSDSGLQACELSLTDADVAEYRRFNGIETKRSSDSILERWRRSGFAA